MKTGTTVKVFQYDLWEVKQFLNKTEVKIFLNGVTEKTFYIS